MDHEVFASRTKEALRVQSEGRADDAAVELRALLQDLEPATKTGVNGWHQQQVLALLVDALDAAGKEEECREAWEQLIQFNQRELTYWQEALFSARKGFAHWRNTRSPRKRSDQ